MSRIGRLPVPIPQGVKVGIDKNEVTVEGPKGKLVRSFPPEDLEVALQDGEIVVIRKGDQRRRRALHGLTRALINNMVTGVTEGFTRDLDVVGVGYRAELQGNNLVLYVGYSHPVTFEPPEGIQFFVEKGGRSFSISGIDKEMVGEYAARVRRVRPPEPYKGKGIQYRGEVVRRKAGKAGKKVGG